MPCVREAVTRILSTVVHPDSHLLAKLLATPDALLAAEINMMNDRSMAQFCKQQNAQFAYAVAISTS